MRKGRRIKTLRQLAQAAQERRSVIVFNRRHPAAVIMNWQAAEVHRVIEEGLFINIPKRRVDLSKPPRKWTPPRYRPNPEPSPPILNLPYYP